ncbi:MAG: S8 family serine peptidase [Saprospiraceae bacterium]|nr:S8 family serine peptidase [Saprospiraceae bacterium]
MICPTATNRLCLITSFFLLLTISTVSAQKLPDYRLQKGGELIEIPENITAFIQNGQVSQAEELNGYYFRLVQFYFLPNRAQKQAIEQAGIELLSYIPNNIYTAAIPTGINPQLLQDLGIRSILKLDESWKLSKRLIHEDYGDWAVEKGQIKLLLTYFHNIPQAQIRAFCGADNIEILAGNGQNNVLQIQVPLARVAELAQLPYTAYLDVIAEPGQPEDTNGRGIHRSNAIDTQFSTGRKYTGEGINIQTRDDGEVGPHIDFQGRVTNIVNAPQGGTHGDGVSGIFTGAGNLNPYMRGMAAGAHLFVTNYVDHFLDTTLSLHQEQDVLVTNSSYSNGCNGGYTSITQTVDQQMYENPTYLHVFSAGNAGTSDCGYGAGQSWGNITGGHKQGKNVMATANLDTEYLLRITSSRGPAYDGRIKPDIAANGHNHQSTNPYNVYIYFSGTSAAAPGIAGVTAQLHQAYQENNGGETAEAALLKAIMLNTANDMGNAGPDFLYGWGHVNALRAARAIEEEHYFSGTVDQLETNEHQIQIPAGTRQAKIMVYWSDFPAEAGADIALVNDLDTRLISADQSSYLPYVLSTTPDPNILSLPALPGEDHLNNMEQIALVDPAAGIYTLEVSGFNVPMGPVKYWVVLEFLTDEVELIYPYGGEGLAPNDIARIHWDGYYNGNTYDLDYSLDNGQNWISMASGISASARYWDWTVPDALSGEALVRVSRGNESDICDVPFSIIGTPQNLEITKACPDFIRLEWDTVPGATYYDVFQLGDRYMDSVGTTQYTIFDFYTVNLDPSLEYWYSVRAVVPDAGIVGERAIAIGHNDGLLNCVQAVDISMLSIVEPSNTYYTVCAFNEFPISIEFTNQGSTSVSNIEVGYNLNGDVFTETLAATLDPGENNIHVFSQQPDISVSGMYDLQTWVHLDDDSAVFNDSTESALEIVYYPGSGATLDIQEDFELPDLAPYWYVANEDNGITWSAIDSVIGITGDYTRAYWMDNYSYSNQGSVDRVITVPIDLTDPNLQSPALFFDISYAPYPSTSYVDTLQLEVYSDCQSQLTAIPYKKWASELQTVDDTFFGKFFPETSSDWRTEVIDLSPYLGTVITLHFVNTTGYGNSLFLDNINIRETSPPVAFFDFPDSTICVETSWTFEDASTGEGLSYQWNFGPGAIPQTATGQGPHEVTFTEPGQTEVSLSVGNAAGIDTYSQIITILPYPVPNFGFAPNELKVSFTNLSTDADTYLWDFGDGIGQSPDFEPVYTYAEAGDYEVSLVATNDCFEDIFSQTITVTVILSSQEIGTPDNLRLSPNPTTGQVSLSLDYPGGSNLQLEVYDISGKRLLEQMYDKAPPSFEVLLDLDALSSGVYFVRLWNEEMDQIQKLIIE